MKVKSKVLAFLLFVAVAGPALAAPPTSEANGKIVDQQGNPIVGAKVIFRPKSSPDTVYEGKTNKKGKYYVPGMFNPTNDGDWVVEIEAEGYVAVRMIVESRTVNRVLIGDVTPVKLKPNAPIPDILIRPMGSATVDFTMVTEQQITEELQAAAAASAEAQKAQAAPQRDPWDTALSRAGSGELEGSIEFFEQAVEDEPEQAERHKAYAQVLYQLERYDEAESRALSAAELAPNDVEALMVLYSIHVGKGDLAQAEQVLVHAREVAPQDRRVLKQLAFVASESGNTAAAIEAYEGLVGLDPQDAESWVSLASLYAEAGAVDKSEAAYQRVVEIDPDNSHQVFFNLGALIMNNPDRSDADTQRAIAAFRKAIELKPDYVQAHKQLGFALLGAGDRAGAKSELEAYVRLAPDAADAAQLQALINSLQ